MELRPNNDIKSGDSSHNNQAGTINNHYHGLTFTDVKSIVTSEIDNKLSEFKNQALAIATDRFNEINGKLLERLKDEDESTLDEFSKPGMQDSLFNAQKAYAVSDDTELADMLVEMLIERAKIPEKNRRRIILDESLKIAPKLTTDQMDLLTIIHFFQRVKFGGMANLDELIGRMNPLYSLINSIDTDQIDDDLTFMETLGLGKIVTGSFPAIGLEMIRSYPAYFMKGFTLEEINAPELTNQNILIPCFHDNTKFQFASVDKKGLIEQLRQIHLTDERIDYISSFFDNFILNGEEITNCIESRLPDVKKFNECYSNSVNLKSFLLGGIGMTIALANYERRFGEKKDLAIWVK